MFGNILATFGRIGSMLGAAITDPVTNINRTVANQVWRIAWPILTTLIALGVLLAIWIGIRLATAQDEGKRREAKTQLIYAIIAIFIVSAAMMIFGAIVGATSPGTPTVPTT